MRTTKPQKLRASFLDKYGLSLITFCGRSKLSDFSLGTGRAIFEVLKCENLPIINQGYTLGGTFLL